MEEGAQWGTANIINRTFGHKSFFNVFLKFFITDLKKEQSLLVRRDDDTKLEGLQVLANKEGNNSSRGRRRLRP